MCTTACNTLVVVGRRGVRIEVTEHGTMVDFFLNLLDTAISFRQSIHHQHRCCQWGYFLLASPVNNEKKFTENVRGPACLCLFVWIFLLANMTNWIVLESFGQFWIVDNVDKMILFQMTKQMLFVIQVRKFNHGHNLITFQYQKEPEYFFT